MWPPLRSQGIKARFFHASVPREGRQIKRKIPLPREVAQWDLEKDFPEFENDDIPATGHMYLHQQRRVGYYLRLIENECRQLVAFRKPIVAPSASTPLVIRSIDYAGEKHPVTVKRSVVVPVGQLPLKDDVAIHKAKLLAGVRWSEEPPKDSGVLGSSEEGEHGYIKISCEDFPRPLMNLKWISDAVDRLVAEANDDSDKRYQDLPLDTRHIQARVKKAGKGEHARGRKHRPGIQDFPKEWLPQLAAPNSQSPST